MLVVLHALKLELEAMLDKRLLLEEIKAYATANLGWKFESLPDGGKPGNEQLIELFGVMLEFILKNNQVNVVTPGPGGPGTGKMT